MRTVTLDPPVFCSGLAVTAISRVSLWPKGFAGGVAVAGSKHPLAVLLHDGTAMQGLDLSGRVLSPAEIESLLPGAAVKLAAAWRSHHDTGPSAAFSGDGA